jgi:nitroreductase
MTDEIGLLEGIRTLRAMRRLTDEPVTDDEIRTILEAATRAPSGMNSQPWAFIVVRDQELKKKLQAIYWKVWEPYEAFNRERGVDEATDRVLRSARHLAEHFHEVPVIIVPCIRGRRPSDPAMSAGRYASIFPAVQNLMLAARALGLGTALTTLHMSREAEVREALAIPENVEPVAFIPVGRPRGKFGVPPRRPVEEVMHLDTWGNVGSGG